MGLKFQSTKLIDGFSACFRQERAHPSHCSLLHGYALSFKVIFEGELDYRNWVVDFGFMKTTFCYLAPGDRNAVTLKDWFNDMFDHTVLVAGNDSEIAWFKEAHKKGIMKVWFLPSGVGCERFAEMVFKTLRDVIGKETEGRVRVVSVECIENHKNSAIVYADNID